MDDFRKGLITWVEFEEIYSKLMMERAVLEQLDLSSFADACLLCSEPTADHCHRRLATELVASLDPNIEIIHL